MAVGGGRVLFPVALLWAHFVCDYPLQGAFLSDQKGKNWLLLFSHAMIQAGGISLVAFAFGHWHPWVFWWVLGTHGVMDAIKARWMNVRWPEQALGVNLWIDQAVHVAALAVVLFA